LLVEVERLVVQVLALYGFRHRADQPETSQRCAGRLQPQFGSNMWSWRTNRRA
jgi:hypothetical protein